MIKLFGAFRILAALATLAAIIGQFAFSAARSTINPFNFFGYFTIQSNIIALVAFVISAYFIFTNKPQRSWVIYLRALAATYMVIVGLVYNTLLSGANLEGSFSLPWSNDILHIVIPIYVLLDWILFSDHPPLEYRRFWLLLIYPIVWLIVILIRGATDGWVPYPFLNPSTGYGAVTLYCLAIAVFTILFGLAMYALSRVKVLKP